MKSKEIAQVLLALIVMILIVCLSGCKTIKSSREHTSSYRETVRDSLVFIPGENVKSSLDNAQLAAIMAYLKAGNKEVIIPSKTGDLQLKYYLDQFGKLQVECMDKDKTIQLLVKQIEKEQNSKEIQQVEKIVKIIPARIWILVGVMGSTILILSGILILKQFRII